HGWKLLCLAHHRDVPAHLWAVERHSKEEPQCGDRAVYGRRLCTRLALMHLILAQIFGCGRGRRAAEERQESLNVTDVIVLRFVAEVAHVHIFDHARAQRADGRLAHRSAPCPEIEAWWPLHPQARALHIPLTAMILPRRC